MRQAARINCYQRLDRVEDAKSSIRSFLRRFPRAGISDSYRRYLRTH
jgi:hypothetical protein